jgi:hypothetical protein
MRKPTTTNTVLLVIIAALTLALVTRGDTSAAAWAQGGTQPTAEPPFNASEQRKVMIASLQQMQTRLAAIESKLNGGLTVKVTEMPPVVIKEPAAKK